jgi:hypothetical protein
MTVPIHGIIVFVTEIPTVYIVNIPVAIIVDLVSGNFARIFPDVAL